jgi:predicted nucleic acid-binding protein
MAREVVLDANVLVGWLDKTDSLAARTDELIARLRAEQASLILLDVLVGEAVSVVCRRAAQRKSSPPDLARMLDDVRAWSTANRIRWTGQHVERLLPTILDIVAATNGRTNFNDALLIALQREKLIGAVASFDAGFDAVPDFERIA